MVLIIQGIIFFIVFAVIQYIFKSKNILGSGRNYSTKKEVLISSILTSFIATAIYLVLVYYFG